MPEYAPYQKGDGDAGVRAQGSATRTDAERHLSQQDQRQGPLVSSPRGPRASRTMWCGVWCVCGTLGNRNALAAPSTFAAGASRVQVKFTTCMPTQHGTAKFPKAFTFLPLSVQLGRMPSHLHIASGCNDMGPKRVSSRSWGFNLRFEPHSYAIWWLRVAVLVAPRVLDRVGD